MTSCVVAVQRGDESQEAAVRAVSENVAARFDRIACADVPIDLVERRIALAAEIAGVARPVGRIDLHRFALGLNGRRQGRRAQQQGDHLAHRESSRRNVCGRVAKPLLNRNSFISEQLTD